MLYDDPACVNSYLWNNLSVISLIISTISIFAIIISFVLFVYRKIYGTQGRILKNKVNNIILIVSIITYVIGISIAFYVGFNTYFYYSTIFILLLLWRICTILCFIIFTIYLIFKLIKSKTEKVKHFKFYGIIMVIFFIINFLHTSISNYAYDIRESDETYSYCWSVD